MPDKEPGYLSLKLTTPGSSLTVEKKKDGEELQLLAESKGFWAKCTSEVDTAAGWLKSRRFDLALISAATSFRNQQDLAGLLWAKNPNASFLIYDLENKAEVHKLEARMSGGELISGKEALEKKLAEYNSQAGVDTAEFKIMLVEDLDSPREIICSYIENIGYRNVVGVRRAKDALAMLRQDPDAFSCVLTDVKMPEMNGEELILAIRADADLQHIPVIVITAIGTVETLVSCLRAGASGFLLKPPKRDDLTRELARAVRTCAQKLSPRMIGSDDAEAIRELLISKGFS